MAFQTRFASCASTVTTWLTVRDTVAVETLARLATSRMSTSPLPPSGKFVTHSIRYPKSLTNQVLPSKYARLAAKKHCVSAIERGLNTGAGVHPQRSGNRGEPGRLQTTERHGKRLLNSPGNW